MTRPSLLRGAAATVVGLAVIGVVRAAARIGSDVAFGVEGLATMTIAMSLASLATIVGAGGLTTGITKVISGLRGEGGDPRPFTALALRWSLAFAILGAVVATAYLALTARASGALVGASIVVLILAFAAYQAGKAVVYGEERIASYVRREVLGALLFIAGFVVITTLDRPMWVVLPLIAAYVPVGALTLRRLWFRGTVDAGSRKALLEYGVVGIVGSLAGIGFTYVTPLVADVRDPVIGAALIGAVLTVLEPIFLAPRAISLVLLPALSYSRASGNVDASALVSGTAGSVLVAAPITALLFAERDRVLQLVFSDELVGGATLGWFAFAVFVSVAGAPAITALAAIRARDAGVAMLSSLTGLSVAVVVWIVWPDDGIWVVAFGYAVGSVIQVVAPILVASKRYEPQWGSMWARVLAGWLAAALIGWQFGPSVPIDIAIVAATLVPLAPEIRRLGASIRAGTQR